MQPMLYDDALQAQHFRHTSDPTHDFLIFIGRFQPFHRGHHKVLAQALEQAGYCIILIGSSNAPRSHRNPWSFYEREAMIRGTLTSQENDRLIIRPLEDRLYNNTAWVQQVQELVESAVQDHHDFATSPRIGLIGHNKDSTSYYLRLFPQWTAVNVDSFANLDATYIRDGIFSSIGGAFLDGTAGISSCVRQQLSSFTETDDYRHICDEYEFIRNYKKAWATAPYPPTFVTTDAVVVQSGHILLVRRGAKPGKGLLALPGGYLQPNETIEDGMLRELREETRIRVPDPVLRGSIVAGPETFDDPHRDPRGRFITHAFLINLEPRAERGFKLPEVKGSDDADHALWMPLAHVKRGDMFIDHFDVIMNIISRL